MAGEHLSIGEVLAALHDEFPDITISKIRFLESQGLIDPERTPSGYRKFYADDVTRLRWILFQQKENFLPLKVIKERLEQLSPSELARLDVEDAGGHDADEAGEPEAEPAIEQAAAVAVATDAGAGRPTSAPAVSPVEVPVAATPAATPRAPAAHAAQTSGNVPTSGSVPAPPRPGAATRRRPPGRPPAFAPTLPLDDPDEGPPRLPDTADDEGLVTRDELCAAAGVTAPQLASLEEYGLVTPAREAGNDVRFDADAVETATIAAGFFARGVEARHLRMYRTVAEREASLFGQVLLPYLRQRNPDSRARLQSELVELARLGRRLRTVQLRDAVRDTLSE
jgi:DNA-binding transcriptional MerR regulator